MNECEAIDKARAAYEAADAEYQVVIMEAHEHWKQWVEMSLQAERLKGVRDGLFMPWRDLLAAQAHERDQAAPQHPVAPDAGA